MQSGVDCSGTGKGGGGYHRSESMGGEVWGGLEPQEKVGRVGGGLEAMGECQAWVKRRGDYAEGMGSGG